MKESDSTYKDLLEVFNPWTNVCFGLDGMVCDFHMVTMCEPLFLDFAAIHKQLLCWSTKSFCSQNLKRLKADERKGGKSAVRKKLMKEQISEVQQLIDQHEVEMK